tara:strand:+ start:316 stop:1044 length:729 start_codon:yes stop_codon:yes gene_type:complete
MRLCISGTSCQGKSTLIKKFLERWPNYTTPKKTYRDVLIKEKLSHSKETTKDTQWAILNNMIDEFQKHDKDSHVIYDRGPLDNLVYTIYAYSKDNPNIDDVYVGKTIELVKETLKLLDINFLIPITKFNNFDYKSHIGKEKYVDVEFIEECNTIFQAIKNDWETNPDTKFFDIRDMPAIIEVYGTVEQRLQIIGMYLNQEGDLIDEPSILSESEIYQQADLMEKFGIPNPHGDVLKNPKGYE